MSVISITEHSTISYKGSQVKADTEVSKSCFDWLVKLSENEEKSFAAIKTKKQNLLKVANYVGVLQSPCGTTIEILPKTTSDTIEEHEKIKLREKLIELISISQRLPLESDPANLQTIKNPTLHEWLMGQFLQQLKQIVLRGLRFDYERIEEESRFIRGRLRIEKQLQQGPARQHLFQISHEIFSPNRAENRLLKTALEIVFKQTKTHWQLANELKHMMDDIPNSTNPDKDFLAWQNNRLMKAYDDIKTLCYLIIKKLNPTSQYGDFKGVSLLFPMEKLFEDYVGHCLQSLNLPNIKTKTQSASKHLCTHNDNGLFALKPDFLLTNNNNNKTVVLDAKWKLINDTQTEDEKKYGISQADLYQMFAYGHKYLNGQGKLFLIYPSHEKLQQDTELHPFVFEKGLPPEENLELYIVPCDWQEEATEALPRFFKNYLMHCLTNQT